MAVLSFLPLILPLELSHLRDPKSQDRPREGSTVNSPSAFLVLPPLSLKPPFPGELCLSFLSICAVGLAQGWEDMCLLTSVICPVADISTTGIIICWLNTPES